MTRSRPAGAALPRARTARSPIDAAPPSFDEQLIVVSEAFDAHFYRDLYPDIVQSGADPVTHYMTTGWRERRDPAPWFSTGDYLDAHPEAGTEELNPFFHFLTVGRARHWSAEAFDWRDTQRRAMPPVAERIAHAVRNRGAAAPADAATLRAALAGIDTAHVTVSQDNYTVMVGGVQLCIDREAQALAGRRAHLHLFPTRRLPVVADDPDYEVSVLLNGEAVAAAPVRELAVLADVLAPAARSTVAVHSLLGHHPEALSEVLAALRPAQSFFWIHDFTAACDGYNLLKDDAAYCGGPPRGAEICKTCRYGPLRERHLQSHDQFLSRLQPRLVAPSEAAAAIWTRARSTPDAPVTIHPHAQVISGRDTPRARRPIKVAFPGLPVPHKGWPAFRRVAEALAADARYEFHHFADEPDVRADINFHRVTVTADDPQAMTRALRQEEIEVAVIWSICPETFCLTAREAVAAGAGLVAYADSGAAAAYAQATGGEVLASDAALLAFFESGQAEAFAAVPRRAGQMVLSGMSVDLMSPEAANG